MSAPSVALAKHGVPVNTSPPTISGALVPGQTLVEGHGTWAGPVKGYTVQWLLCDGGGLNCAAIAGATFQDYTLVAADLGHQIRVQETASNSSGASAPATSAATADVTPGGPVNQLPPSISGNTTQGQTLTEVHGTWTLGPTGYSYQWESCNPAGISCTPIAGATNPSYTLGASDIGHTVRVTEIASNTNGASAPASSSATAVVVATGPPYFAPSNTLLPVVLGSATVGQILTTSEGAWSGNPPPTYKYVWQRCLSSASCSDISGATGSSYTLSSADVGAMVRTVITATNNQGSQDAASSEIGPVTVAGGGGNPGPGGGGNPGPSTTPIRAQLLSPITPRGKGGRIGQQRKHGGYTYARFKVSTAGKLTIRWYYAPRRAPHAKAKLVLVASVTVTYTRAGAETFKIRLTAAGKRLLALHPRRLSMTATAWFNPTGASAIVVRKRFTVTK
jgi:hypothetical protein